MSATTDPETQEPDDGLPPIDPETITLAELAEIVRWIRSSQETAFELLREIRTAMAAAGAALNIDGWPHAERSDLSARVAVMMIDEVKR